MKISVGIVSFLFFCGASVAAQVPPDRPGTKVIQRPTADTEVTRLRKENAELKQLVELLQKKVELLEQSTKASKSSGSETK